MSIPAKTMKVKIPMSTLSDSFVEDDEYFKATLSLSLPVIPEAVVVGSPEVAFVTITDTTRKLWFTSWVCTPLKMNS